MHKHCVKITDKLLVYLHIAVFFILVITHPLLTFILLLIFIRIPEWLCWNIGGFQRG